MELGAGVLGSWDGWVRRRGGTRTECMRALRYSLSRRRYSSRSITRAAKVCSHIFPTPQPQQRSGGHITQLIPSAT